jgi:hypothetical protein
MKFFARTGLFMLTATVVTATVPVTLSTLFAKPAPLVGKKMDMTRDQVVAAAKEEAEETGRKFEPSSIHSGKTVYQLAGPGAVILDK